MMGRAGLVVWSCWVGSAWAEDPTASIDAFVAEALPASGAPGIAYAVVDQGRVVAGAHGEILSGSGVPLRPDTPFPVGSLTKGITAVAVMQLVERGAIGLDDPISQHLEDFADGPGAAITVRQLLSHTSGYSTLQGNDRQDEGGGGPDALAREVARIARWTPAHEPGTRWDYSNANYRVLGGLIEAVGEREYAAYVEEHVLAPIGMTDSFVADGGVYEEMAVGHVPWFGAKRPLDDRSTDRSTDGVNAPAGGVVASAEDTARYLAVMMNGEDDVLRASSKAEMMRPAGPVSPHYGLGWGVDPDAGTVAHTGTVPGADALAVMVPEDQRAVVILVNGAGGMGFGETAALFSGVEARGLGVTDAGVSGRGGRMALFGMFALAPLLFLASSGWTWSHRDALRAKSGSAGQLSVWFPLVAMAGLAWVSVGLIPHLFGVSVGTLYQYQPDFSLGLVATAVTGVGWAVFRVGVYLSGRDA